MKICISSGHSTKCRGASGYLDEVDEATKVVDRVAVFLRKLGVEVEAYHDTISTSQNENLNRIVDWHNSHGNHDLDVSVHFNAYQTTSKPMGTEVLWITQEELARDVSAAIAKAGGFIDRGGKKRDDLFFLSNTIEPAILIETCFVDSQADTTLYRANFFAIIEAISWALAGTVPARPPEPDDDVLLHVTGKCSTFGGPNDTGVAPDEGLAFIHDIDQAPYLFMPYQPSGTSGLARRLNPYTHYIACRWDYSVTPKSELLNDVAMVRAIKTGVRLTATPADWGPNQNTGRVADLSPSLMQDLGIETDDEVEVIYPWTPSI
jgi:N-acetylmuramoyl-L-alanine amidase